MPSEKTSPLLWTQWTADFSDHSIKLDFNLTITGSAPHPLLHNLRCELETVILSTVYIYGCLFIR